MRPISGVNAVWMAVIGFGWGGFCLTAMAADPPSDGPKKEPSAAVQKAEGPQTEGPETEIAKTRDALIQAFDAGKAEEVASNFLPEGEWIDEFGNTYHGQEDITTILKEYFEKYPGAKMSTHVEKLIAIGPVAFEEGTRTMTCGEDAMALIHYTATLAKTENGWRYVSVKDMDKETLPTAHQMLQPLGWLVGEWVNEGPNGRMQITYRWSEDRNYLLGTYEIESNGEVAMKSEHRIGWDPLHHRIRTWLFDSDGSFGEGVWTQVGDDWHIQSSAILPDGGTGSAIIRLTHDDANRFTMIGTHRVINGIHEEDFDFHVVRKLPGETTGETTGQTTGATD